ncbi:MAG: hypothetical protein LBS09_03515 [Bacteroidales bacterium]|jgi:hypothetical protein|nr:hypothetical protein [Bacteroidales bacterium]
MIFCDVDKKSHAAGRKSETENTADGCLPLFSCKTVVFACAQFIRSEERTTALVAASIFPPSLSRHSKFSPFPLFFKNFCYLCSRFGWLRSVWSSA